MMIADISLIFDAALATLLAVMIFYSVRLNKRIAMLREGEGELQQMVAQFSEASLVATESARRLKAAGTEAEIGVKAAVAKGMALQNELGKMLDQAELLVDRMDDDRYKVPVARSAARQPDPEPARDTQDRYMPDRAAIEQEMADRNLTRGGNAAVSAPQTNFGDKGVQPFSPPIRSADEVVRAESAGTGTSANNRTPARPEPRTEAERHLLDAIRAAKQGVA